MTVSSRLAPWAARDGTTLVMRGAGEVVVHDPATAPTLPLVSRLTAPEPAREEFRDDPRVLPLSRSSPIRTAERVRGPLASNRSLGESSDHLPADRDWRPSSNRGERLMLRRF
ncbi:MAG: hypothetical protein GY856_02050 [bacterium]|nr:hypothetical protein [bacterium]